jgi:hypothetical protein
MKWTEDDNKDARGMKNGKWMRMRLNGILEWDAMVYKVQQKILESVA